MYWAGVALNNADPWFVRVPSKSNISDGISRFDEELAVRLQWQKVEIDVTPLFQILVQYVIRADFDAFTTAKELLATAKSIMERAEMAR